jgi:collagen type VI alpha
MVFVLDSSSSITKAVWQEEVELASHIIRSFYVGPDASHVGVFHYNHDFEVVSEIFLNSGLSTTQIQQQLHDIRYKDVGTMTGKALQHALSESLTVRRGNRANVYDNLVLITDGRSQDDVSAVAQALKASGAHVFAVGISMKNDGEATVRTVASEPSHALFYPNLNGDSLYDIANQIAAKIHADQCPPGVTCKTMKPVRWGTTTCTNENRVGSVCTHVCHEGLTHYPKRKNVSECVLSNDKKSARFNPGKPCCVNATRLETEMCPPLPDLDVVVVVDSSSSVRIHNWGPQIKFVKDIVSMFDVGYDKTRVGVFRYNKLIDQSTEIKLKDATNMTDLLAGIDAIPYDGSGTLTGAAINYTLTHHLSEEYGNRANVEDFVIVITDGRSQDDVVVPSELVRESGAMVFAVGVGLKEGGLETMDAIAGNPENAFNIQGGFEALQEVAAEIQNLLKKVVCHPCKRLKIKKFELKETVAAILKETLAESQANASEESTSEENTSEENTSEEPSPPTETGP